MSDICRLIGDVIGQDYSLIIRDRVGSGLFSRQLHGLLIGCRHAARTLTKAQPPGYDTDQENTGTEEVPSEWMDPILLSSGLDPGPHVLRHGRAMARQFLPQGIVHTVMLLILHLLTIMPLV